MTWKGRYSPEPLNSPSGEMDGQIDERLREALNSSAVFGSYANGSIPQSAVRTPVVSQLPVAGADGDEVYYVADSDNGIVWHFRYRAAGSPSYPWEFVGGPEMRATNAGTSMTTTSATYVDLSTVGPTITAPLAGEYRVEAWAQAQHSVASALGTMALKIGSAATSDTNAVRGQAPAANYDVTGLTYSQIVTVSAASTVLKMQFKTNSATLTVNNAGLINPWMTVRPVRVGV